MTFAWPHLLALLLVPLGLIAWELLRRRHAGTDTRPRILRAHAGAAAVRLADGNAHLLSRRRPRLWLVAGLACAAVAMARPQWGLIDEEVFDQSREIVVAVDLSKSMLAQDVKPSRLERAKLLVHSLLERLQGERVGLLLFAGTAFLQSPLSADYEILHEFLPNLSPKTLPEGGSNYEALLDAAVQAFAGASAADRYLVILSDGEATDDGWKARVGDLKAKGIRVIGLGVGTPQGAVVPDGEGALVKDASGAVVLSRLENRTLVDLAEETGGVYRDASTWLDISALLQATVETGRRGAFIEKSRVRRAERFQWALAPAFFFLLMSFAREFPVRPRPREMELVVPPPPPAAGQRQAAAGAASVATLLVCVFLAQFPAVAATLAQPKSPPPPPGIQLPGGAAPEATVNPGLEPLTKTVDRVSRKASPSAGDWSEMAQDTLAYGGHFQTQKQPVPEGPVNDALAAVDAGEKLDAKAADWARLRRELRELLVKPPQEEPPPPEEQQKNESGQQEKSDQQEKGEDGEKSEGQPGDQENAEQNPDGEQGEPMDQKKEDKGENPNEEEAFGDMDAEPGEIAPEDPDSQKVGGSREARPVEVDPSLTLPLQKLEQLKNQDSPARLFQLMEGPAKAGEGKTQKDW